jgi:hypothetical protein
MSQIVPVTFSVSPMPSNFRGTQQQFAEAIVSRLAITSPTTISFFVSGPTAPTSNEGPWLKNGMTWYVWNVTTGAYIPQVIEFASLQYIWQQTAPDHNLYTFWGQLDGSGKAQSIQYFVAGAWHDVYEDKFALYSPTTDMTTAINTAITAALTTYSTTALMNAAIGAAIGAIPAGRGVFKAQSSSNQLITFVVSGTQTIEPVFGTVLEDPDSCFSGNQFTAPANGYYVFFMTVQYARQDSNTTHLATITGILKNGGVPLGGFTNGDDAALGTKTDTGSSGPVFLALGDTVSIQSIITVVVTGTSVISIDAGGTIFSGYQIRGAT